MIRRIRRFLLRLAVTPERARSLIARVLSLFLAWATETRAWDAVSLLPRWLRRLADFIDCWNAAELPADKDRLISELVKYAVTDAAVDRLIDTVVGLRAGNHPLESVSVSKRELVRALRNMK